MKTSCAYYIRRDLSLMDVTGRDHVEFLHNILTNDVKQLTPQHGIAACLLNAQAKIIVAMHLIGLDNHTRLIIESAAKGKLLKALDQLLFSEDVQWTDRTVEFELISVSGDLMHCEDVSFQGTDHGLSPESCKNPGYNSTGNFSVSRVQAKRLSPNGLFFIVSKQKSTAFLQKLEAMDAKQLDENEYDFLRIEAGIPKFGADYDEATIPFEAGFDDAISFTKGCYPGQEIIARLDSRGGVSKKLCLLEIQGDAAKKTKAKDLIFCEGKEIGWVTSACDSPASQKTMALGYLKKGFWDRGKEGTVKTRAGLTRFRIASLEC